MNCRHCRQPLDHVFLDLGFAPPSNAYLSAEDLRRPEVYYPLKLYVCEHCWLVQTEDHARADELFRPDYAYFSSVSQTWLAHAARSIARAVGQACGDNPFPLVIPCHRVVSAAGLGAGRHQLRPSVTVPPEVQWLRTEPEVVVVTLTRDTGGATPVADNEARFAGEEPTPP